MVIDTRYLIVGGGLTGDAACRGILEVDREPEQILLVSGENHPPYARPPLSKALWKGDAESTIWRQTANLGVHERLGRRIVALDLDAHTALDDRGQSYAYEKLLLATGGRPRRLPFGGDEVIYFRTLDDYHRLRRLADAGARIVVIGGGFIGSEIAAALALNGVSVTMVLPQQGIGARIFPAPFAAALTDYYRQHGVEVLAGVSVTGIEHGRATLGDGRTLESDAIAAGLGIEPLGSERRVGHEDHAKSHGRQVGANMAGATAAYDHLPFFYSDLFDLGYEAVGELDSRLNTLSDVDEVSAKGTIYYLDDERRPRGVLLWNKFGEVDAARELVRAGEPLERKEFAGRVR